MRPENGHTELDFSELVQARDYRAETFPRNRSSARVGREVKRPASWSVVNRQLAG
jgi:hypothetical protein